MKSVVPKSYAPEGRRTVTPRLFAKGSRELVGFLRTVFGAKGRYQAERPTELQLGDSTLMVNEVGARPKTTACLYVYVRSVDATYRRALKAQARPLESPQVTSYGEYRCTFEDRWNNVWQVAERNS